MRGGEINMSTHCVHRLMFNTEAHTGKAPRPLEPLFSPQRLESIKEIKLSHMDHLLCPTTDRTP